MKNISGNPAQTTQPPALPAPFLRADAERGLREWLDAAAQQDDAALGEWMRAATDEGGRARSLLEAVFGNSPYLSRLLFLHPRVLHDFVRTGADKTHAALVRELLDAPPPADGHAALMRHLRVAKSKLALLVALADISGEWRLEQVTDALSGLAEKALCLAMDAILTVGHRRGEIEPENAASPSENSGIIVLGMGKLGGHELNYSSDIDLIIFYEPGRLRYKGRHNEQHFMNRLAHELVTLMQERTQHGYVFRTDLRLRPDPASTPPAITVDAAYSYYESVGQNWERAALIKARPVAGDIRAGERFTKGISPFMWRRSLDFASINDIHSIKRQMDTLHSKVIEIRGHNIKLGMGGIREIEFYVQIHQLIWGGREPVLRTRGTCETLFRLTEYGLVDEGKEHLIAEAYAFYRKLEHRLQMVADEQTHSMPDSDEGVRHIAMFMGFPDVAAFEQLLFGYLNSIHAIYASSFKSSDTEIKELGEQGNLVFTGTIHDPETLKTLRSMGYSHPETISEIVMGWHHGSRRATRTKRARELLTELMPLLLKRLGETANPDHAFLKFNEFLLNLPAGVQLFSLFQANPHLLGLISDIMGSAPMLADTLSKSPELLDAVLYADFYNTLPSQAYLAQQLQETLALAADFESCMDALRRFRNEKQFQAGVQLLKCMITAQQAGIFLSALADVTVQAALDSVTAEFARTYGVIPGSRFAIIALGKLGSREITFGSDIDLVFVYDAPDFGVLSDGEKELNANVYYNRMAQRLLNALTAMGRDGRLYEVDTRLRPSGKQGLLAVSTQALAHYFDELAWTFEYMAMTKARATIGDASLCEELNEFVRARLSRPRDAEKLRADVADMRERIHKEYGTDNAWDIKYARGGMMDLDFMAQYLILLHAPATPGARPGGAPDIFRWLSHSGRMTLAQAAELNELYVFLSLIFSMLRLCYPKGFDEPSAPPGLQKLLVEAAKEKDFASLKARLIQVEQTVTAHYITLLNP